MPMPAADCTAIISIAVAVALCAPARLRFSCQPTQIANDKRRPVVPTPPPPLPLALPPSLSSSPFPSSLPVRLLALPCPQRRRDRFRRSRGMSWS
ncbi:hypothetical protein CDD83_464 [Cordyceps sp. RAO-2017]|nr:hypothetical protein CDD83_464 [Cordyceps sp. RAO-2017]